MDRTNHLIEALAQAARQDPCPAPCSLFRTLALSTLVAAAVFFAVFGTREAFWTTFLQPPFVIRSMVLMALAVASVSLIPQLARPGADVAWHRLAVAPLILLALLSLPQAAAAPAKASSAETIWICLGGIALLAIWPAYSLLQVLRHGAVTQPVYAGAIAGLGGGAIGALFYSFWCTETAAFYITLWYGAALAVCAGAGALAGRFWLRW